MIERDFYVTIVRGKRTAFLAGPFVTHERALGLVPAARDAASKIDPWTDFDASGTASMARLARNPDGKLNEILGVSRHDDASPTVGSPSIHGDGDRAKEIGESPRGVQIGA
jgi:hypothetical protein